MDSLQSLWKDLSDRFRSPFVISFLLSWMVWNWELTFTIFNFDPHSTLLIKTGYIHSYIDQNAWLALLFFPLITSFGATAVFYFFKAAYLGLDSLYENRWRIWVIRKIGMPEMVPRTDLDDRIKEIENYKKTIQSKDDLYSNYQTRIQELQKNVSELSKTYTDYTIQNPSYTKYQSLSAFFKDDWVCEFNWIKNGQVNYGAEIFSISGVQYKISGQNGFTVEDVRFDKRADVLTFKKQHNGTEDKENTVRLFMINENLWSGIEKMDEGYVSYIRIYSVKNKPDHIGIALNNDKAKSVVGVINNPGYSQIVNRGFS